MSTSDSDRIDASVSKSFFVDMLVRDIDLPGAIRDLVDNCIDGAKRLRGEGNFTGLEVDLRPEPDEFSITDNCGGIDIDTALNYAFKFGRPSGAPTVPHSLGRFGVGMKRAIFKLGKHFSVSSISEHDSFEVEVDVTAWEQSEDWSFRMTTVGRHDNPIPVNQRGTSVKVTDLTEEAARQFSSDYFLNNLRNSISARHQEIIDNGLLIKINGLSIPSAPVRFLVDNQLTPAHKQESHNGVVVRQVAGVGESIPGEAGWYVFCNGRMVLQADQSEVTGWGEPGITRIPRYHNQFARFRGCVYFDSEDATSLPWNTTKDGVDVESMLYQSVRNSMTTIMRPVINFLNDLDAERDQPEGFRPLTLLVDRAIPTHVAMVPRRANFGYERPTQRRPRSVTRVQYDRNIEIVRRVQRSLGVSSARAAGEGTFDYYVDMELEQE